MPRSPSENKVVATGLRQNIGTRFLVDEKVKSQSSFATYSQHLISACKVQWLLQK